MKYKKGCQMCANKLVLELWICHSISLFHIKIMLWHFVYFPCLKRNVIVKTSCTLSLHVNSESAIDKANQIRTGPNKYVTGQTNTCFKNQLALAAFFNANKLALAY